MATYIADKGNDFEVQYLNRAQGQRPVTKLKVSGDDGNVTIASGVSLGSTLGVTGAATVGGTLGVTGAATVGSTLAVTGNGTVGGTLGVTGAATVGGTLGVTGAATVGGTLGVTGAITTNSKTVMTGNDFIVCQAGRNLAGALTLTGAAVGDAVVGVFNLTTPGDLKSSFETAITVVNEIQQSAAVDLSTSQIVFILHHP